MVTFEITSSREVTINGIGLLRADEPVKLTKKQVSHFEAEHGHKIGQANFPEYVQLLAVTSSEDEEREEVK